MVSRMPATLLPAFNDELVLFTANSLVSLAAIYYGVEYYLGLKGKHQTDREKSWVLTAISSAVMTACSIPYIWSWFAHGAVFEGGQWADRSCCFFIAYLLCDLIIGSLHYRSSINLLTGWIHHTLYITLLTLLIIPHSFASLFNTCCILELPTLLLALGSLNSSLRNDYLFALVFFATRICLHVHFACVLAFQALSPHATTTVQVQGDGAGDRRAESASWIPPVVLAGIFPMHAMWMKDCVRGILRRRRLARARRGGLATPGVLEPTRVRDIPVYLLARSSTRTATLLRRSRQHLLRMLHEALEEEDGISHARAHVHAQTVDAVRHGGPGPARWRTMLRRRVVGRLRRVLPEYVPPVPVVEVVVAGEGVGGFVGGEGVSE